jgi:predicted AAA+ superfamily ATPase
MFRRSLNILEKQSFFLFGARGTGKSTLLQERLPRETLVIDLLKPEIESAMLRAPQRLHEQVLQARPSWVMIDEVQKAPRLLDVVHSLIESDANVCFALTGSSARKLKHGSANLLAGRAFVYSLFPLTSVELADAFSLQSALQWGSLPRMVALGDDETRAEFLRAYAQTYLKEEIFAEQLVRGLEPFRIFLEIAAQSNGEILNYTKIAEDVGVDTKTVQSYYQILEDTLVGILLPPFHRSLRKRQRQGPRFYFFDLGVKRALDRTLQVPLPPSTYAYGRAFEHFVILEAHRRNEYGRRDYRLSFLRTHDDAEIDLVIERPGAPTALVEIKSTESVTDRDLRTLRRFKPDLENSEGFCLSRDPIPRQVDGISVLPWAQGLDALGL